MISSLTLLFLCREPGRGDSLVGSQNPLSLVYNDIKSAQKGDQKIKIVKFTYDTTIFLGNINCFPRPIPF